MNSLNVRGDTEYLAGMFHSMKVKRFNEVLSLIKNEEEDALNNIKKKMRYGGKNRKAISTLSNSNNNQMTRQDTNSLHFSQNSPMRDEIMSLRRKCLENIKEETVLRDLSKDMVQKLCKIHDEKETDCKIRGMAKFYLLLNELINNDLLKFPSVRARLMNLGPTLGEPGTLPRQPVLRHHG